MKMGKQDFCLITSSDEFIWVGKNKNTVSNL